jgi:hypothetical protein
MRGLIIDPKEKATWIQEIPEDGLAGIYAAIEADCFDVVRMGQTCGLNIDGYVDDEGLFREDQSFFELPNGQVIAGRMLVLASDDEGETVGLPEEFFGWPRDVIDEGVKWLDRKEAVARSEAGEFDTRFISDDGEVTRFPVRIPDGE